MAQAQDQSEAPVRTPVDPRPMGIQARLAALGYWLAPLFTLLGFLLRATVWNAKGHVPYAAFLPAVMFAAWLGGLGVGLLTTLLSALAGAFFFLDPIGSLKTPGSEDFVRMLTFIGLGVFLSVFNSALQKFRKKAEARLDLLHKEQAQRILAQEAEERQRRALAESEQNLVSMLESITDGLAILDPDYRMSFVNPAAERIIGRAREELLGQNYWDEFPLARDGVTEESFARVMTLRAPEAFEHLYAGGRWLEVRVYPYRAGGISVYFRDITWRKHQVEEMNALIRQLGESRAILDTLFEQAPIGLGLVDRSLRFIRVNRAFTEIVGAAPGAHAGNTIPELLPDVEPALTETFARVLAGSDAVMNQEARRKASANAREQFWSVSCYPVSLERENIGVGAIFEDITARREAEEALRKSEATFRQIAESMPQLVWTTDARGGYEYFNRRWYDYAGLTFEESRGEGWTGVLHPDDRERTLSQWEHSLQTGAPFHAEYRLRALDGVYRWFLGRAVAILNDESRIVRWFGTCTDIDDQKKNEEALRQANSDLEQFAYSASHDLREPLRNVTIYTQLLEHRYGAQLQGDAKDYLGFVVTGARRMDTLIRDLLEFTQMAGSFSGHAPVVDTAATLEKVLSNFQSSVAASGAQITWDPLPPVRVQEMHLMQLLQNLIGNALKYRSEKCPIIHISAVQDGTRVIFGVRDNGIGIDPRFADRIFGLFRRLHTNDRYEGTGIGLAICQRIVERYGGRIWVQSELGNGSEFRFLLPGGEA